MILLACFCSFKIGTISTNPFSKAFFTDVMNSNVKIPIRYVQGIVNSNLESINIKLKKKKLAYLDSMADAVLEDPSEHYLRKVLPKVSYVKGKVIFRENELSALIKYTGGQIDHFDTERRSIRVKLKEGKIKNCSKFNLYHPKVREGGIEEWFDHMILKELGLIYLETGYMEVKINEQDRDVYFFEQAYGKDIIVTNKLDPGFVIRIKGGEIDVYNDEMLEDDYGEFQFKLLKKKTQMVQENQLDAGKLFNLNKMAVFCAAMDIMKGYHALRLYNIRFYFNFKTGLLEPIGREFGTPSADYSSDLVIDNPLFLSNHIYSGLFLSNEFQNIYFETLFRITKPEFIERIIMKYEKETYDRRYNLYKSDPYFNFDYFQCYYAFQSAARASMLNKNIEISQSSEKLLIHYYTFDTRPIPKSIIIDIKNKKLESDSIWQDSTNSFTYELNISDIPKKNILELENSSNKTRVQYVYNNADSINVSEILYSRTQLDSINQLLKLH